MEISATLCFVCNVPTDRVFYCPKTESRACLWLEAMGIDKKYVKAASGSLKLCRKHFNNSDFTNSFQNRLNRNAVPSLFLKSQKLSATISSISKTQTPTTTVNSNVIDLPINQSSPTVRLTSKELTPMIAINPDVIELPVNEEDFDLKNVMKSREFLYRLIISQLFYDGHQNLATSLSAAVQANPPCSPSNRLLHIMIAGIEHEPNRKKRIQNRCIGDNNLEPGLDLKLTTESQVSAPKPAVNKVVCITFHKENINNCLSQGVQLTTGLEHKQNHVQCNNLVENIICARKNLELEIKPQLSAPEPALYKTGYIISHEGNCRVGCFSQDGQLVATGSVDTCIKILDVKHALVKSTLDEVESSRETTEQPVIRKLCDHVAEVTALEFHPKEPILVSGSRDFTVKLFNTSKPAESKAFKTLKDDLPIRCLAFHPVGIHLLVGVSHPSIRLYDINTAQCLISSLSSQHTDAINSIKYSQDAKYYATASRDGSIKLWDGVSNICIHTFIRPHNGDEVCSVTFTQNGRYLLSSGKDSLVRLWELRNKRCLFTYTGANITARKQEHKAQAVFNHTEDYILFPDEVSTSLCVWNSHESSRKQLMYFGHNAFVRMLVHSPTQAAFLTCSDDFSARLWFK